MQDNRRTQRPGLGQRAMSGMLWTFSGQGVQFGVQFATLMVLARLITPTDFGVVAIAMIVVNFSEVFSQIGTGAAIVHLKKLESEHIRAGFIMASTLGILFSAIVAVLAGPAALFFDMERLASVLRVVAFVFVLNGFRIVAEALLQREMRFKIIAASNVLSYTLGFACIGIPLALAGFGIWALVAAHIGQALCKTLFLNFMRPHPRRLIYGLESYTDLLYYGGGFAVARLGNFTAVQGDNIVIGRLLGAEAIGMYGRAYQLMLLPVKIFGNVLDVVLFPAMASVQDDKQKLSTIYQQGVTLVAIVTLPASVLLFHLAPEVILGVLGPQWEEAVAPFRVLAIVMLFRTSYRMSDSLAKATGLVYRRAWRQWVYAFCVIFGAYIGARYGIVGVAVGVAGATVVNFLLMAGMSLGPLQISWSRFLAIHLPAVILALLTYAEAWFLVNLLRGYGPGPLWIVTIVSLAIAVTMGLLMAVFPGILLGQYGKDTLRRVVGHFMRGSG